MSVARQLRGMPSRARLVALALLIPLLLPVASAAQSLGVTPAEIEVSGAQRGQTYVREVTLQNQFDTPSTFTVEREGETGAWARIEPSEEIVVPPRSDHPVLIVLDVPADAANGAHEGAIRFVGAAKERPEGSGFALRYAVAVPLHVELGGPQRLLLRYVEARASDVEVGTPARVLVSVLNEGNVRAEARASGQVLDFAGTEVARATNATQLRPGERVEIEILLPATLPEGTYRVLALPEGAAALAETSFKVVPVGTLGKEGVLRYLRHEPSVQGGLPVRVTGVFENTGAAAIARARLVGEVWQGDRLVAVFTSDELATASGETTELVAYFTSPVSGELRLVAHVVYDGFRSPPNEGILVAGELREGSKAPWILGGAIGLVVVASAAVVLARRSRRR